MALDVSGFVSVPSAEFQPALDRVESGETTGLAFAQDSRLARTGRCPAPAYVTKRIADEYVAGLVWALLWPKDQAARDRGPEIERLRAEAERTERQLAAFMELADAVDADDFRVGYRARRDARDDAKEALAAAQEDADARLDLPTLGALEAMPPDDQRRAVSQ